MSWQNLIKESENMVMFLKNTFTKPVANLVRLALKKGYSTPKVDVALKKGYNTPKADVALKKGYNTPKVDVTKCPMMDRVMKGNTLKETKEMAAKQQMLMLNAVAALVRILENA